MAGTPAFQVSYFKWQKIAPIDVKKIAREPDNPIKPGDYILRFNELQNNKIVESLETPIRQENLEEINISDSAIIVQPGNSLWRISRRFYGKGVLYTLIFKANNNLIDDPDLIFPGQIFNVPKK